MHRLPGLAILLASCASHPTPEPAAHNTITAEEKTTGWQLLFDGRTMDGWNDPAQKSPPGKAWIIEDGCLKATNRPRLREDLLTTRTFGNFELVFDWRISPGGNSGVKYRIQDRAVLQEGKLNPDTKRFEDTVSYELENRLADRSNLGPDAKIQEYAVAFEFQVIDNGAHADAERGPKYSAGALYDLAVPSTDAAKPVGEFNHSRILLQDDHVEHWLNGVKVVDIDLSSEAVAAGLANRWTTDSPVYQLLTTQPKRQTPIALQHHNDEAWFRNIKIREL